MPLYCSPKSFSIASASMPSSTDSAPRQTMFFISCRSRDSAYVALQISVSGIPSAITSSRNFSFVRNFVES